MSFRKKNPPPGAFRNNNSAVFESECSTDVPPSILKQARKSGQLNLSNRGLVSVPHQVYSIHDLDVNETKKLSVAFDCPNEKWWDQVELAKLILASNKLTSLSPEIKNLCGLQQLDLHDNMIESLPPEIGSLKQLQKLNVSRNKMKSLPKEIYELSSLRALSLQHNQLTEVSDLVGNLNGLEELDLGFNCLVTVPPGFGFLSRVTSLNLSNNVLTSLPPDIGSMNGLRLLNLSNNCLEDLPLTLGSLTKLEQLWVRHNKLLKFPCLQDCRALKDLQLGNNFISEITSEFLECVIRIKILDLRDNKLKEIPSSIGVLQGLERLDLTNNGLNKLPPELTVLPNLKTLALEGNPIKSIRRDILQRGTVQLLAHLKSMIPEHELMKIREASLFPSCEALQVTQSFADEKGCDRYQMRSSQSLVLSGKELVSLPDSLLCVAEEEGVVNVDLSRNRFEEIPGGLSKLYPRMTQLNLSFNRLESVCSLLGTSSRLQYLNISNNRFKDLPISLEGLENLREINISFNRFTSIPKVISSLKKLEILFANDNKIERIEVEALQPLKRLATLSLQNNSIGFIPPLLGNMTQLTSLTLEGNLFRHPRPEILSKGTSALLQYLQSRIPP